MEIMAKSDKNISLRPLKSKEAVADLLKMKPPAKQSKQKSEHAKHEAQKKRAKNMRETASGMKKRARKMRQKDS